MPHPAGRYATGSRCAARKVQLGSLTGSGSSASSTTQDHTEAMRTQIWILAASFFIFGIIAWVFLREFSLTYLGLMMIGVAGFVMGLFSEK